MDSKYIQRKNRTNIMHKNSPTRHLKTKGFSLGEKQDSSHQISISSGKSFREMIIKEAIKRQISVSKLMRDSTAYAIKNKIPL